MCRTRHFLGGEKTMTNNNVALLQKDITDTVSGKLEELENTGLKLPSNYNAQNALKSAFFKLQTVKDKGNRPALQVCTKESIANSLLDMVTQGLSPAKTQCYFVVYGNELQLQRSYFGTQTVLKRLSEVEDIWAEVIHEGDSFEIGSDKGRTIVKKFEPKFENLDNPIIGAFAVIQNKKDSIHTVMTKKEIDASWSQTKTGGSVQKKFPQEMAKRTVINRAAKNFINTSDDSDLLADSINRTMENEYDPEVRRKDVTETAHEPKSNSLADQFRKEQTKQLEQKEVKKVKEQESTVIDVDSDDATDESTPIPSESDVPPEEEQEEKKENMTTDVVNWQEKNVADIKSTLDFHDISYDSHARKPELVALAEKYVNGGLENGEQAELF